MVKWNWNWNGKEIENMRVKLEILKFLLNLYLFTTHIFWVFLKPWYLYICSTWSIWFFNTLPSYIHLAWICHEMNSSFSCVVDSVSSSWNLIKLWNRNFIEWILDSNENLTLSVEWESKSSFNCDESNSRNFTFSALFQSYYCTTIPKMLNIGSPYIFWWSIRININWIVWVFNAHFSLEYFDHCDCFNKANDRFGRSFISF